MDPLDLQSRIKLDDGSEVSVADLIQSRKDLEDAIKINDTLQKDLQEVGVLFQAGIRPERRENAIRNVLENLGYEDQQITQYLDASRQARTPQAPEPEAPDDDEIEEIELPDLPDEDDDIEDSSGGEQEDTMSTEREQQLRQELEAQRAEIHKMRVRELRENLNSQLDRVLKNNPDFQKLIESARSTRGDDGVKQAEQTLRSQLEQRALERMQSRRATAGTFEDSWMSEEVEKAVEPVVGSFRSVIGDIDKLGRSSETVTGLDAQEILRSKPVPVPEYKPGATLTDVESDVKNYAADTIRRALASSPGESVV
jgi:hypothetical protein